MYVVKSLIFLYFRSKELLAKSNRFHKNMLYKIFLNSSLIKLNSIILLDKFGRLSLRLKLLINLSGSLVKYSVFVFFL